VIFSYFLQPPSITIVNYDAGVEPRHEIKQLGFIRKQKGSATAMKMKIGEFAHFCDASVRALHLYDAIDLLKPAFTDPETKYRYYLPEQMETLNAIISYKKVGFTLSEIKELISPSISQETLVELLKDKLAENERTSAICLYNNENIQSILSAYQQAPCKPDSNEEAVRLARIACLENEKLEHDFSKILWL
jgi:DNA-binding transcriptional MerR regulator